MAMKIYKYKYKLSKINILSVGWDLIPYPVLHQFFENDTVLCFPDVDWKTVENFCTTLRETSTFSVFMYFWHP
jgi:hypothetical protein